MTHLAIWLLVCIAVAMVFRGRPMYVLVLVLLLWTAVPAIAGHRLTGLTTGAIAFHPASWLLLVTLGIQLFLRPRPLVDAVRRQPFLFMIVAIFIAGAFLTSRATGSGGTRLLLDQIVGPFLLFWIAVAHSHRQRSPILLLRNTIILAMAAESLLAVVQKSFGSILFYESDYERLYWFDPERFERWMGTTDSPLVFSLGLCVAGALALGLRAWILRSALLFLFLIGTIITQARTGSAVMCAVILYSILRSQMVVWARALTVVAVAVAGIVLVRSDLVAGLVERLTNDTGSTDARLRALQFMAQNWTSYFGSGFGMTSSYTIARDAGLQTSIESSYLMYVVDVGLILATAYFGAQLGVFLRYGNQHAFLGGSLAAAIGLLLQHTFSGVAGTNLSGSFIWAVLALMVVGRSVTDAERLDFAANDRSSTLPPRAVSPPQPVPEPPVSRPTASAIRATSRFS